MRFVALLCFCVLAPLPPLLARAQNSVPRVQCSTPKILGVGREPRVFGPKMVYVEYVTEPDPGPRPGYPGMAAQSEGLELVEWINSYDLKTKGKPERLWPTHGKYAILDLEFLGGMVIFQAMHLAQNQAPGARWGDVDLMAIDLTRTPPAIHQIDSHFITDNVGPLSVAWGASFDDVVVSYAIWQREIRSLNLTVVPSFAIQRFAPTLTLRSQQPYTSIGNVFGIRAMAGFPIATEPAYLFSTATERAGLQGQNISIRSGFLQSGERDLITQPEHILTEVEDWAYPFYATRVHDTKTGGHFEVSFMADPRQVGSVIRIPYDGGDQHIRLSQNMGLRGNYMSYAWTSSDGARVSLTAQDYLRVPPAFIPGSFRDVHIWNNIVALATRRVANDPHVIQLAHCGLAAP